jgi:hypothetical protein
MEVDLDDQFIVLPIEEPGKRLQRLFSCSTITMKQCNMLQGLRMLHNPVYDLVVNGYILPKEF